MDAQYVFGIIISILLSVNVISLKYFISSIKELKKVIQDLALAVRSSQKDIEYIHKELALHAKVLDKHDEEIDELKLRD